MTLDGHDERRRPRSKALFSPWFSPYHTYRAAQVSPSDMTAIAVSAQQHDDSIVDRAGGLLRAAPDFRESSGRGRPGSGGVVHEPAAARLTS